MNVIEFKPEGDEKVTRTYTVVADGVTLPQITTDKEIMMYPEQGTVTIFNDTEEVIFLAEKIQYIHSVAASDDPDQSNE